MLSEGIRDLVVASSIFDGDDRDQKRVVSVKIGMSQLERDEDYEPFWIQMQSDSTSVQT